MSFAVGDKVELRWALPQEALRKGIKGRIVKVGQVKQQGVMVPFYVVEFENDGSKGVVYEGWLRKWESK